MASPKSFVKSDDCAVQSESSETSLTLSGDTTHYWQSEKNLLRMSRGAERRLDRIAKLMTLVKREGKIHLADASTYLDVSEMTLRRDIADCGGRLDLLGGFIVSNVPLNTDHHYNITHENIQRPSLKEEACLAAVSLIEQEDILFIDCGTTTPYLATHLPSDKNLTVICYSLNIAEILCRKQQVRVVLLGGLYHPESETFAGDEALKVLEKIGITKAFLSAGGVHPIQGVSCSHFHEVAIKQAVLRNAEKKYLIVDSAKINRLQLAFFSSIQDFDGIATDHGISSLDRTMLEEQGVAIVQP